jgi:hypothetical protein
MRLACEAADGSSIAPATAVKLVDTGPTTVGALLPSTLAIASAARGTVALVPFAGPIVAPMGAGTPLSVAVTELVFRVGLAAAVGGSDDPLPAVSVRRELLVSRSGASTISVADVGGFPFVDEMLLEDGSCAAGSGADVGCGVVVATEGSGSAKGTTLGAQGSALRTRGALIGGSGGNTNKVGPRQGNAANGGPPGCGARGGPISRSDHGVGVAAHERAVGRQTGADVSV